MALRDFSWVIPNRLAGMALPGGRLAAPWENIVSDVQELQRLGVRCLVSLEGMPGGFIELCRKHGIECIEYPIKDHGVPADPLTFSDLVDTIVERVDNGEAVCVHCLAGVGRTGMVLVCVVARLFGISAELALRTVTRVRAAIENLDQEAFVRGFCRLPSERPRRRRTACQAGAAPPGGREAP